MKGTLENCYEKDVQNISNMTLLIYWEGSEIEYLYSHI